MRAVFEVAKVIVDGETAFLTDRISGLEAMQQSKHLNVLACMRVLA